LKDSFAEEIYLIQRIWCEFNFGSVRKI